VGSIEAKKTALGRWEAYIDTGREATGIDALAWAEQLVKLGAGELLVTSIDHEGMKNGFEIDLIQRITHAVGVPVIACGGCGRPEHIEELLKSAPVSAVACASIFHYGLCSISEVKKRLNQQGIFVSDRNG
jgi:cyclase